MKLFTTLAFFCFYFSQSFASDTTIVFSQLEYGEIFEIAKQEQKNVFLYFHFDGCGACRKMERTAFNDKAVADYYNENFISYEINTRKGEGIDINKIYEVQMHPSFLYLDTEGNILHKVIGVFSPEDFVLQARNAMNPETTLKAFKEKYEGGNREPDFLLEYCYKMRDAYELDSLLINEYLESQSFEAQYQVQNIKFIYEFAIRQFDITMPYGSKAFQFLLDNKEQFYEHFEPEQVDTRIVWVLNRTVYEAIEIQDEELFKETIKLLADYEKEGLYVFKEMDGRQTGMITTEHLVLSSTMAFYEKSGDKGKFNKTLQEYIDKIWDDSGALNTIAWNYFENVEEKDRLEKAKNWIIRSIELRSNYNNADTYAALLYKLEDYEAALKQAEKAMEIAKEEERDFKETAVLKEKIMEKMKE